MSGLENIIEMKGGMLIRYFPLSEARNRTLHVTLPIRNKYNIHLVPSRGERDRLSRLIIHNLTPKLIFLSLKISISR
jgi:hypothetical protein